MATVKKRTWETKTGLSVAWVVRYYDAKGERHSEQFDSKTEANGRKVDIEGELRAGTHTALSDSPTVRQAGEDWYQGRAVEKLEDATLRSYRGKLDNHIYPLLGARKIAMLSAGDIEQFKKDLLAKEEMTIANARKIVGQVRMIFKDAVRTNKARVNVAAEVRVKSSKREKKASVVIPSKEAVAAILKETVPAAPSPMTLKGALTATMFFSGLRKSELRGLPWPNVELSGAHPYIKVGQRADEKGRIGPCKSEAGFRTIPIGPKLVSILRRWKLASKPKKDGLVFPSEAGTPLSGANIHNRLWMPLFLTYNNAGDVVKDDKGKPVLRRPYLRFHDARHWFASLMIDQELGPKQVQERMGHSTIQVTMDLYGHLFRDKGGEQEQARRLEGAIKW